jgi:predicted RNase H-like HicB family nuclease
MNQRQQGTHQLTALIEPENEGYVAWCPELDIASQGATAAEARQNLLEATQLFFDCASPSEIQRRFRRDIFITRLEVVVG